MDSQTPINPRLQGRGQAVVSGTDAGHIRPVAKPFRPGRRRGGRNQHSVSSRIEAFFAANPGIEMTIQQVADKVFSVYRVAGQRMAALHKAGALTRRKEGRLVIYRSAS